VLLRFLHPMLSPVSRIATLVGANVIAPFCVWVYGSILLPFLSPTWGELAFGFSIYFLMELLSLTMNHRFFAHSAFETSRPFRCFLACVACLGMQFGPLWWSSKHRRHHKYCDGPKDPHSWVQGGFWYAWVGWTMAPEEAHIDTEFLHKSLFVTDEVTGKKVVAPELLMVDKFWFMPFVVMNCLLVFVFNVSLRTTFICYFLPSLWCVAPILLFNVMFHPHEGLENKPKDKFLCLAADMLSDPMAVLYGEAHHEDHHSFPAKAHRPGFDLTWYILLKPMLMLGLIWNPRSYGKGEKAGKGE
jgi:stearoyl-CoA desaturase (delta-9 desaturase)